MVNDANSTPFFSVILPTFNRRDRVGNAVRSVLNQTFTDWELLIVDDGSTDGTGDAIRAFTDTRLIYQYQDNLWPAAARNRGIRRSQGRYICFLDSDDEYLETHLSVLHDELVKRGFPKAFLHTLAYQKENGEVTEKRHVPHDFDKIVIGKIPEINSICIARDILVEMTFDESLPIYEDAELWGRIALKYPVITVPKRTTVTTFHESNITGGSLAFLLGLEKAYLQIFSSREHLHYYLPRQEKRILMKRIKLRIFRYYLAENRDLDAGLCFLRNPLLWIDALRYMLFFPLRVVRSVGRRTVRRFRER